ncbi:sulfatase [Paludibacter sp.]
MNKLTTLSLLCIGATQLIGAQTEKKPNILFVIFDDLRPELKCYGNEHIISPNIDAIAQDGTLFMHSYCQQAVSAATRASFLTGLRPDVTGVQYPYSVYFVENIIPKYGTIQKRIFDEGEYYVRTLGKVHHGYSEDFTEPHYTPKGVGNYALPENKQKKQQEGPFYEIADAPDEAYRDGLVAQETIETIKRIKKQDKPFFLSVGFVKPHLPFAAPKKYFDLYKEKDLPVSPNPQPTINETGFSRLKGAYDYKWLSEGKMTNNIIDEDQARKIRHGYYAATSFADAQLGKIIKELKRNKLYDNTYIIIIGDHGWHLGDNAHWAKSTNFERATFSPLIVKAGERGYQKSKKCNEFVEYVDIYPTIMDIASYKTPDYIEGLSFMPLLKNSNMEWKSAAFSQFHRGKVEGYAIRNSKYRYIRWVVRDTKELKAEELYDEVNDPFEQNNIAKQNPELCTEMNTLLEKGWKYALPKGVVNNSNNPIAPPFVGWGPEAKKELERQMSQ